MTRKGQHRPWWAAALRPSCGAVVPPSFGSTASRRLRSGASVRALGFSSWPSATWLAPVLQGRRWPRPPLMAPSLGRASWRAQPSGTCVPSSRRCSALGDSPRAVTGLQRVGRLGFWSRRVLARMRRQWSRLVFRLQRTRPPRRWPQRQLGRAQRCSWSWPHGCVGMAASRASSLLSGPLAAPWTSSGRLRACLGSSACTSRWSLRRCW
mmetsp:Transcript_94152/g.210489  ORF Transcript_94152/g.210489 Transcript_94152/m.210489 type:complete len:209 (-) Transcript_94152:1915-2541(-)